MNKNVFNRLLAVASLAMLATARLVDVDEDMIRDMNDKGQKFVMGKDEKLTILMDKSANWTLLAPMGAPYTVYQWDWCNKYMSTC